MLVNNPLMGDLPPAGEFDGLPSIEPA